MKCNLQFSEKAAEARRICTAGMENEFAHLKLRDLFPSLQKSGTSTGRLKKYCVKEKPAYQFFYDVEIGDKNRIVFFRELFRDNDIQGFMKHGIEFMILNRDLIPD